jgi:predicted AlkP superfamily phosphohydrolase/phosphomutase
MTEKRFTLAQHFLRTRPWDFFMMVEMGTDRMHHAFWKFMDADHPKYEPGNPYESVIDDYYVYVDGLIGDLLEDVPEDAHVLVVSDHGAKGMDGGICINEWLLERGYLVLKQPRPQKPTRFADLEIDWSRTRAWGDGGYYGRIFLNVAGREPTGCIPAAEYESFRSQLAEEIAAIPDEQGRDIGTQVFTPEELYQEVNRVAPDLLVYFGGLRWRSVGTVGLGSIHTFENDTGPDDANHAEEGLFILAGPGVPAGQQYHHGQLMDIAPTILQQFGLPIAPEMQGRPLPLSAVYEMV